MSENNQFDGYQPQAERRSYSASDLGYQENRGGLFKNPLVALLILVVTAGVFAGIIAISFSGGDAEEVLPVVRADNSPVKEEPVDRGGMEIPNADSTIFAQIDNAQGGTRIEDLFANETAQTPAMAPSNEGLTQVSKEVLAEADALVQSIQDKAEEAAQTLDSAVVADKPKELHAAGSSPETLAFVRSVLEEKKIEVAPEDVASNPMPKPVKIVEAAPAPVAAAPKPEAVAKAEPAAGVDGTHYVQMASIQDRSRASGEWAKLLKKYPSLSGSPYRVQEKVIAGKGTFYRIQAGPFVKDAAVSQCEAVKAASGGCFLVAK